MPELKVAILEDDPEKLERYETAITKAGHRVVSKVTDLASTKDFLDHFSDDPVTTPDVVLVDGTLDEEAMQRSMEERERRQRLGRHAGDIVLQGDMLAEDIKHRQDPKYRERVMNSQSSPDASTLSLVEMMRLPVGGNSPAIRIPKGSIVPEGVKVIGISAGFPIDKADIPAATPEQVVEYLNTLEPVQQ